MFKIPIKKIIKDTNVKKFDKEHYTELYINARIIDDDAFSCFGFLRSVVIGPNVEKIGARAFAYCKNLRKVNMSKSKITKLNESTFEGCESLTSFKSSIINNLGLSCFEGCKSLTTVDLPACKRIPTKTFKLCSSLQSYNLANIISIGSYAFSGTGLKSLKMYDSTESIENNAFEDCRKLKSVEYGNNVFLVPDYCFCNCIKLETFIPGKHCLSIGKSAFMYCCKLISIALPNVVSYDDKCFAHSGIYNFDFGKETSSLGHCLFYGCNHLYTVSMGNNIEGVYEDTFKNCEQLLAISVDAGISVSVLAVLKENSETSVCVV